jgi:hypothetical protein
MMGRLFTMLIFLILAGGAVYGGYVLISDVRQQTGAGEDIDYGDPVHLVVGIDLSQSNVLVSNDVFARKVADRIRPMIENLPPRSEVTLRTFGVYQSSQNVLRVDRTISARNRPEDVATLVHGIVAGVPQLVADGRVQSQGFTNILAFLENTSQLVDCRNNEVIIVLATDGVEDSDYVRLQERTAHLPEPDRIFRGCDELHMLGIGQGLGSPATTTRLRQEWEQWADTAGFRRFVGLNDW